MNLVRTGLAALVVVIAACSHSSAIDKQRDQTGDTQLSGCNGKASSSIPSSGVYGLTTFGGPTEPQPLACGGNSDSGDWYYAASSQRYGCGVHLQVTANGKCVVAQVADYGPDVCVENAAGHAILDASPLVGKALFGESDLGWSDDAIVHVTVVSSSAPLGPCATSSGAGGASSSSSTASSTHAASSTSVTTGGGAQCSTDGDCNPGDEGSGKICVQHACVPGCNADWECPGVDTCIHGMCSNGGQGGASPSSSTASSTAASTSASTGGGGTPCTGDGDCNPGDDGSGMICTNDVCVPGCHHDYQCPGDTSCIQGFCQ